MANKNTKLIKITSRGMVTTSRGRVVTPINRPYRENVDTIFKMLTTTPAPTILEILGNGRTVKLSTSNFDKDNELVKPEVKPMSIVPSVNNADEQPGTPEGTPEAPVEPAKEEEIKAPETNNAQPVNEEKSETSVDTNAETTNVNSVIHEGQADEQPGTPEGTPEAPVEPAKEEEIKAPETNNAQQQKDNNNKNGKNNKKNKQQQNVVVDPELVK